jgi:hypothetical protein
MDDCIDTLHRLLDKSRFQDGALDALDSRIGQFRISTSSQTPDSVALLDQLTADRRPEETSVASNKDALGHDGIARCAGVRKDGLSEVLG